MEWESIYGQRVRASLFRDRYVTYIEESGSRELETDTVRKMYCSRIRIIFRRKENIDALVTFPKFGNSYHIHNIGLVRRYVFLCERISVQWTMEVEYEGG